MLSIYLQVIYVMISKMSEVKHTVTEYLAKNDSQAT